VKYQIQASKNALPFVSNLTKYKDLDIKTVLEDATVFYERYYIRLENHENPLIEVLHIFLHFLEIPAVDSKENDVEIF